MTTSRYSMRDCRDLLQTNEKSLKAWLRKAEIEPQVNLMDERKKYITRAQLEQLARLHDRVLPEEEEEETSQAQPSGEILAEQVTTFQQALEHRLDQMDQTLHQVLTLLQDLLSRQIRAPASARETAPIQKITVSQPASPQQARPASKSKKKKTARVRGQKLPQTYVPLRTFAQAHQVSLKAMEFASKAGKIPVERGQWRYNNHLYVEALSPTGQQEFYKRFHERAGFIACEHCPHELPASL